MFKYFPTPMDWIMFMMVGPSMTTFSASPLDDDVALAPSESDTYSKQRPRRNPLRAGTASAAVETRRLPSAPRLLDDRRKTPTETLDGDESNSVTARGMPKTHSDNNRSKVTITYASEDCTLSFTGDASGSYVATCCKMKSIKLVADVGSSAGTTAVVSGVPSSPIGGGGMGGGGTAIRSNISLVASPSPRVRKTPNAPAAPVAPMVAR
mmetsp:Transcript_30133/g.63531  ORF Transcript_30133/g.63531 Transcript_30133/m.63531 type:complete len:209 (-) Transcript_30133:2180-2806(-)